MNEGSFLNFGIRVPISDFLMMMFSMYVCTFLCVCTCVHFCDTDSHVYIWTLLRVVHLYSEPGEPALILLCTLCNRRCGDCEPVAIKFMS